MKRNTYVNDRNVPDQITSYPFDIEKKRCINPILMHSQNDLQRINTFSIRLYHDIRISWLGSGSPDKTEQSWWSLWW